MSLIDDLVRDEGVRLKPYRCTAGKLTIGIGRNIEDIGITDEEARYLLANDIARVEAALDRAVPWWRTMTKRRQEALANMAFNLGMSGLFGFRTMLAALQAGNWANAAQAALDSRWADQVGARAHRIAKAIEEG